MRKGLLLMFLFAGAPLLLSATKEPDPPDKEMLKMIEFLKEMEMVEQLEMMRDLHRLDAVAEPAKSAPRPKPAPVGKKETLK